MDLLTAITLGVVQGLTEFLPISSDGHLAIAAMLLPGSQGSLEMVVLLHLGTLLATLIVMRGEVSPLLQTLVRPARWRSEHGRTLRSLAIATGITGLVGLALHDVVEPLARSAAVVGVCLCVSAIAVASTRWTGPRASATSLDLSLGHCVLIGLAQGAAVLPGLSRSGTTIAVAMALGLAGPAAFRLSFLLSLPAIAGAAVYELRDPADWSALGIPAIAGALVAFVVGLAALAGLRHIVARGRFWAFAVYLVPLGTLMIALDLLR